MKELIRSERMSDHQNGRSFSDEPPQNESEAFFMEPGKLYGCAQVILKSFYGRYGDEVEQMVMAAAPLSAGIAQTRAAPCGALIAACMLVGLEQGVGKLGDVDGKYGLYDFLQNNLFRRFKDRFGHLACSDLVNSCCTAEERTQKLHHERVCRHSVRFIHDWLVNEVGIAPNEK